ncbi:MAG: DnaJ domain-containing protein [Clostridia bacterium]|nr:DnaJ domain-containing protein [Clostridia bacterium]
MNDPYKVLGVTPSASDADIKKAYRELAKKYHPDKYADSPLADLASEKMKEVNEAYEQIMNERKNGGSSSYSSYGSASYSNAGQGGYSNSYSGADPVYSRIRKMINDGLFVQAEQELSGIPSANRGAEWYYLMGVVYYRKGFLEDAYNYFQTACRMDPANVEYRSMFTRIQQQRSGTQNGYNPNTAAQNSCNCLDCCECISCMLCSDCLCNSCG